MVVTPSKWLKWMIKIPLMVINSGIGAIENFWDNMDSSYYEWIILVLSVSTLIFLMRDIYRRWETVSGIRSIEQQMYNFQIKFLNLGELISRTCDAEFDVSGENLLKLMEAKNKALKILKEDIRKDAGQKMNLLQLETSRKQTEAQKEQAEAQKQQAKAQKQQAEAQKQQAEAQKQQAEALTNISEQALKQRQTELSEQTQQTQRLTKKAELSELSPQKKYLMEMTKKHLKREQERKQKAEEQKKAELTNEQMIVGGKYKTIVNPLTKEKLNLNSIEGKKILKQIVNNFLKFNDTV